MKTKQLLSTNNKIKLFLFPLYPFSVFKKTKLLILLSVLISLRIVMQYLVIYVPTLGLSISLSWTPLIVSGWIFGPIVGFFIGVFTELTTYALKPTSVWFWMYAIQEPLVGCISGIFGSLYVFLKNKKTNHFIYIIINQLLVIFIVIISCLVLLKWNGFENNSNISYDKFFFNTSKYIILVTFLLFFLAIELTIFISIKKNKKNIFLVISILNLTITLTTIFSFVLGPITAVEYYKFLHNKHPNSLIQYGLIYYLIPRVIKETVKLPLQNIVLIILIPISSMHLNNIKKNLFLEWKK